MMKAFTKLSALLFILLFAACTKEAIDANAQLAGTWKLEAVYADPGDGSGTYRSVSEPGDNSITLKANGEIEVSGLNTPDNLLLNFSQYKSFTVKDSTMLVFHKQADTTTQNFIYKIAGNKLSLIPAGPIMCIEGCGTRFVKK